MASRPTREERGQRLNDYDRESAERIQVEEALRESEERLKFVIEGSQQGLWDWNVQTGIVQRNERCAEMLGYTPEEFKNTIRQWRDLIHPDDRAATKKSMYDHIQGRSPRHEIEYRMLTKEGSYRWILDQATIVKRDSEGRALRVCGTHTDITERKRAEEEREKLKSQLGNAVEIAHLGPWEYDVAKDLFTFNDHFYKIFRTTAEQVGGYQMSSAEYARRFVHPEDLSVVAKEIRKSIEATDPNFAQTLEHRMLYADGTVGHISVRIFIVKDDQGRTIRTYGVNQDITQQKRSEKELREKEAAARQTAEVNRTMAEIGQIITSTLDIEEVYERFAEAVRRLIPLDRISIHLVDPNGEMVHIAYAAGLHSPGNPKGAVLPLSGRLTEYILATRKSLLIRTGEIEDYGNRFPGMSPLLQIGIKSLMMVPLISRDKAIGALSIQSTKPDSYSDRDLGLAERVGYQISSAIANAWIYAEQKRTEEALRESEKRYKDLYDKAPVGYHEMDSQGRVTRINRQELLMLGYSAEEMLGQPFWNFVVENETQESERVIRAKLSGLMPQSRGLERNYRRKDGTPVSVLIDDHFVTDQNGRITGLRTTVRDNTERKRAEEEREKLEAQLRQAQKMESVGRLAGGVAHDFNNMLGIIIGNADLAMLQVDPAGPVYQRLQDILKASHRSAETVRRLLAFARKQTISPRVLNLNDTISEMLSMLHRLIGEDVHLSWSPGNGLWAVKIDPSQVSQILANLTVNARDAITGVGKITIETGNVTFDEAYCAVHKGFRAGQYTMLAVSDTGTGMPKEVLDHLFEPFFTTKEVGKGTGLGLSTIYGIVKQNNGFVNVYSEHGQGTTFKIYFPRLNSGSPENQVQSAPEKVPRGTETVLIVEDEEAILRVGKAMLEEMGYTVLTAGSPEEAIQIAESQGRAIQLLLTDVVMPEMSGRDLADHLKAICPDLKCLYMSGYTANVIAHHGILDEGIVFIQKPFSTKEIAAKVREVLDKVDRALSRPLETVS